MMYVRTVNNIVLVMGRHVYECIHVYVTIDSIVADAIQSPAKL